jgi:hypothetical protein
MMFFIFPVLAAFVPPLYLFCLKSRGLSLLIRASLSGGGGPGGAAGAGASHQAARVRHRRRQHNLQGVVYR